MSLITRIFGSPPEPRFNEPQNGITPELLEDSLKLLAVKNEIAVSRNLHTFNNRNLVAFVFKLCEVFDMAPEMRYLAVELFQRFLLNHIVELRSHVEASQDSASPIHWEDVEKRLKHQSVLRAVSCVQLASKLGTHYKILSVNRAKRFLATLGFRYTTTSIVQSEIRVLKALNFQVHRPSPLEFIEALLGYLALESFPVQQIHRLCLKILDVFYLCSESVYASLKKGLEDPCAVAMEADTMFLAAAVIGAASFILGQSKSEHVIPYLSTITCIVSEDITRFTLVLLKEIIEDEDE